MNISSLEMGFAGRQWRLQVRLNDVNRPRALDISIILCEPLFHVEMFGICKDFTFLIQAAIYGKVKS